MSSEPTSHRRSAILALRFLLEIGALVALGYWGYRTGPGTAGRVALAVGAPLLAAILWGTIVSPKAPLAVPSWLRSAVEVLVLGGAALALGLAQRPVLAAGFAGAAALNLVMMRRWGHR